MSSKTATWIIAAGAVLMFIGLCFLPAALGEHPDADLLEIGACQFSLGALIVAAVALAPAAATYAGRANDKGRRVVLLSKP